MKIERISILLLEDDTDDAALFEHYVSKINADISIQSFGSLSEGKAALAKGSYDLIFSDLNLPDASGMEAVEKLSLLGTRIPILILTGSDEESFLERAADLGVYDIIHKSDLSEKYLKRTIRYVLSKFEVDKKNQELNAQLGQAQKMEAVGQLTGGIAHDFNNKLAIIHGNIELIPKIISMGQNPIKSVTTIKRVIDQAARLTSQLLAFSRKQEVIIETVNAETIVRKSVDLLERVLKENIDLELDMSDQHCVIDADVNQMDQVIMNLVLNARDAIGGKHGKIRVAVELIDKSANDQDWPDVLAGEYVCISVSDSGPGIPQEIQDRIFDPFFTTKKKEEGTGLGLSVVHGIISQHRARIRVSSQLGQGSRFEILFPKSENSVKTIPVFTQDTEELPQITVLYAEDEPMLRQLVIDFLEEKGVDVITAPNGKQALALYQKYASDIDVIVSDVVMPEMTGVELQSEVRKFDPVMPFVFMSGYSQQEISKDGKMPPLTSFLPKPCDYPLLLSEINRLIFENRKEIPRKVG